MSFLRHILLLSLLGISAHAAEVKLTLDSVVPAEAQAFNGALLWVRVWEYDPKLADVGAKNVADTEVLECVHITGAASTFSADVPVDTKEGMAYYVTSDLFLTPEKKRMDRIYFADGFQMVFAAPADETKTITLSSAK